MPDTTCQYWIIQFQNVFEGPWLDCSDPICACDTPVSEGCPADQLNPVTQGDCTPDRVWAAWNALVSSGYAGCTGHGGFIWGLRIHPLDPSEIEARGLGECGEIDNSEHCWTLIDGDGDPHYEWGTESQIDAIATANGWTVSTKDTPGDPCHTPDCWCIVDPTDRTKCLQIVTMTYPQAAIIADSLGTRAIPCPPDESSSAPESSTVEPQPTQGAGWLCVNDDSDSSGSSSGDIRGAGQLVGGAGVICKVPLYGTVFGCFCKPKTMPAEIDVAVTITQDGDLYYDDLDPTLPHWLAVPDGTVYFSGTMRAAVTGSGSFPPGVALPIPGGVPWTLGCCCYVGGGAGQYTVLQYPDGNSGTGVSGDPVGATLTTGIGFMITMYSGGYFPPGSMVYDPTPRWRALLNIALGGSPYAGPFGANIGNAYDADLGPIPTPAVDPDTGFMNYDVVDCRSVLSSASWVPRNTPVGYTVSSPTVSEG